MKVKVKGPAVKLAGKWCFVGDETIIEKEEYDLNKDYVDIIDENAKTPVLASGGVLPNGTEGKDQTSEYEKELNTKELEELKTIATEKQIKFNANIGKPNLIKKIIEASENKNGTEGEDQTSE